MIWIKMDIGLLEPGFYFLSLSLAISEYISKILTAKTLDADRKWETDHDVWKWDKNDSICWNSQRKGPYVALYDVAGYLYISLHVRPCKRWERYFIVGGVDMSTWMDAMLLPQMSRMNCTCWFLCQEMLRACTSNDDQQPMESDPLKAL